VFHDVTSAQKMAMQMTYQASHDALTGLINRREFERRLQHALLSGKRDSVQHTLLYLDLDQFKVVNDTCGHMAGDELLKQLTSVLQALIRKNDTLARLGGDEFCILLENCAPDLRFGPLICYDRQCANFVLYGKTRYFRWD
jgi:diguanylate cyclase (GGDEF)-like protein